MENGPIMKIKRYVRPNSSVSNKLSFLSANVIPIKIFLNDKFLKDIIHKKRLSPIHFQINPTNRCNYKCRFCSCGNVDRTKEIKYTALLRILNIIKRLGCRAITLTGGGEPLMHPQIGKLISDMKNKGFEVSLTTNGVLLDRLSEAEIRCLTWCRISASDDTIVNLKNIGSNLTRWLNSISGAVKKAPDVDWAFSYVVTKNVNFKLLKQLIMFANRHKFAHIRMTPDLLSLNKVPTMDYVRKHLKNLKINHTNVIYQERNSYESGSRRCFSSLIKPLICADGWVYPCCGIQYAKDPPLRNEDKNMRICKAENIHSFINKQIPFDGSACQKCYYGEYNKIIEMLLSDIKHTQFV